MRYRIILPSAVADINRVLDLGAALYSKARTDRENLFSMFTQCIVGGKVDPKAEAAFLAECREKGDLEAKPDFGPSLPVL